MLTIFTPIMTVWNLNEAVDEAKTGAAGLGGPDPAAFGDLP